MKTKTLKIIIAVLIIAILATGGLLIARKFLPSESVRKPTGGELQSQEQDTVVNDEPGYGIVTE